MSNALTWEQASLIFDILVEECGAEEPMRLEFVRYHMTEPRYFPTEYRFIGSLGFGGKFWHANGRDGWYVTCYQEDNTRAGEKVKKANERLAALRLRLT